MQMEKGEYVLEFTPKQLEEIECLGFDGLEVTLGEPLPRGHWLAIAQMALGKAQLVEAGYYGDDELEDDTVWADELREVAATILGSFDLCDWHGERWRESALRRAPGACPRRDGGAAAATEAIRLIHHQAARAREVRQAAGGIEKWIGKVVKKGFPQFRDGPVDQEFMWLEVTGVRDGELVGRLSNVPVQATYLSHGDEVVFSEDEIVAVQ